MRITLIVLALFVSSALFSQATEGYRIYTSKGKKTSLKKMLKASEKVDFVFFGEYHDDPIGHWMQLELLKHMDSVLPSGELMLSFEMFEQDQQALLDSYLKGEIEEKAFKDSCRLWPNYSTDYKPLIEYAKAEGLPVVASNIPRRYASLLFKKGRAALDTLSAQEKEWICPLDFKVDTTLSQYREVNKMGIHMGSNNFVEAQAIKDATMAYFMLKNRKTGQKVLHFNGAFHSDFYQSVIWYIEEALGEVNKMTISTVRQQDVSKLEADHRGRADFIICVDEDMTTTH